MVGGKIAPISPLPPLPPRKFDIISQLLEMKRRLRNGFNIVYRCDGVTKHVRG
jgi:hypothetical protein